MHARQRYARLSAESVLTRLRDAVSRRDQRLDELRLRLDASAQRRLRNPRTAPCASRRPPSRGRTSPLALPPPTGVCRASINACSRYDGRSSTCVRLAWIEHLPVLKPSRLLQYCLAATLLSTPQTANCLRSAAGDSSRVRRFAHVLRTAHSKPK